MTTTSIVDRLNLLRRIRSELIGPRDTHNVPSDRIIDVKSTNPLAPELQKGLLVDSKGEEIRDTPPIMDFGVGVLHPRETLATEPDGDKEEGEESNSDWDQVSSEEEAYLPAAEDDNDLDIPPDGDDLAIDGCNRYMPCSLGMSFKANVNTDGKIRIELPSSFKFPWLDLEGHELPEAKLNGWYSTSKRTQLYKDQEGNIKDTKRYLYQRHSLNDENASLIEEFDYAEIVDNQDRIITRSIGLNLSIPLSLSIHLYPRKLKEDNTWLFTVTMVNNTPPSESPKYDKTLFQAFFAVEVLGGEFLTYSTDSKGSFDEEDDRFLLLYKDVGSWGIGHGCAAGWDWRLGNQTPNIIWADALPVSELPSVSADAKDEDGNEIKVEIKPLANATHDGDWDKPLIQVLDSYSSWLVKEEAKVANLDLKLHKSAAYNLSKCRNALERMEQGLQLIKDNEECFESFRLANLAMLLQQRAQKDLERVPLVYTPDTGTIPDNSKARKTPDIVDEEDSPKTWRAFQIAFLLLGLPDLVEDGSEYSDLVDLIWFPTGGGKTEAYLALASFLMFYERIRTDRPDDSRSRDGVNVIMRYTLRLLTTQQFQRASSLICSMEYIRIQEIGAAYGPRMNLNGGEFGLGLWIGSASSPNTNRDACARLKKYQKALPHTYEDKNPINIRECPWCRCEIGKAEKPGSLKQKHEAHYRKECMGGLKEEEGRLKIKCSNKECMFGKFETHIPVYIVDEEIYEKQPSFLVATVDKFAMLPFKREIRQLFGFPDCSNQMRSKVPPRMIIQDELHLISGPLGSMFGLYETLIEHLCTDDCQADGRPKIICATATIRGATSQIKSLFAREKSSLFPPPALDISDSFFGRTSVDENGNPSPGRMYLGVNATSYPSAVTSQVRLLTPAILSPGYEVDIPEDSKRRDPWWTLMVFYNSFRDLGGGRTLFQSDIPSRLSSLWNSLDIQRDKRRYCPDGKNLIELSGRLDQTGVVDSLDKLSIEYDISNPYSTVEACLTSSIIEVGVDIERLSLISIIGQPTNTARYIQVTGRIGRQWWDRPGLVLMMYNSTRPRDRSHFEQFQSYHQQIYSQVEPTSATPFSKSAIERAVHAFMIGYIRCYCGKAEPNWQLSYKEYWEVAQQLLLDRINRVGSNIDISYLEKRLEEIKKIWTSPGYTYDCINAWFPSIDDQPLLLTPGNHYNAAQEMHGINTPTSLRSVDAQCEFDLSTRYSRKTGL
jgi:hypothetical protein